MNQFVFNVPEAIRTKAKYDDTIWKTEIWLILVSFTSWLLSAYEGELYWDDIVGYSQQTGPHFPLEKMIVLVSS